MDTEWIEIELEGEKRRVARGTPLLEVIGRARALEERLIAAILNNRLVELTEPVLAAAHIQPISASDSGGLEILRQSLTHMFHALVAEQFPELQIAVGQSILGGYFYEVHDRRQPDGQVEDLEALATALTQGLEAYVAEDMSFERMLVGVDSADVFLHDPQGTKGKLLRCWGAGRVPLISLRGFTDIQHGPYAPSTGTITGGHVEAHPPGLILHFPGAPRVGEHGAEQLMACYVETRDWNRRLKISSVGHLNEAVLDDRIDSVIRVAEGQQERKLVAIADAIIDREPGARIVCVAGPSSAGKTTFVKRLSVQLLARGIEPVEIGLDDYYRDRDECPRDANGDLDFESLDALDVPLIQAQVAALLRGEEVRVPRFDFSRGAPEPESKWRPLRIREDQVLLIEGIHGLNPGLLGAELKPSTYRVFLNALTQLVIDEHNRIPTAAPRLLRRLVRDRRYRGSSASETILRWPSVIAGEWKNIYPFQEQADVVFNTALVYEAAVLKTFAWRYLLEIPRGHPARREAYPLFNYLDLFVPVFPDQVPANSVLREYIGGSGFNY